VPVIIIEMTPVMSFSITEKFKELVEGLLSKRNMFRSQSGLIRAALSHYANSDEIRKLDTGEIDASDYDVNGQILLAVGNASVSSVLKKEESYKEYIVSCVMTTGSECTTMVYSFKGNIFEFRSFVDDIDSIPSVHQLRYIIN
jgi:Arc/MetJ-type ribon-helix-helix transcriptional regulator